LSQLIGGRKGIIRYSQHIAGQGEKLLHKFCEAGLEGIVSKRADSPYLGSRSDAWLKIKCIRRQEFVIVGWTPSDKARAFARFCSASMTKASCGTLARSALGLTARRSPVCSSA
jgi:bifunctional non-homologous end joining protein LigD